MPTLNPEHTQLVMKMINKAPFFKHMSMRVTELDIGFSKVLVSIGDRHMNPFGGLHGGVFSSAIDTAAYWSAYGDLQERQGLLTIDLTVDLLAPVTGGTLVVVGKRLKSGKTLFLTQAQMFNEKGKAVAHGISKLMVTQHKQTMNEAVDYIGDGELPDKFLETHVV